MEQQSREEDRTPEPEPETEAFVRAVAEGISKQEWRSLVWLARVREAARVVCALTLSAGIWSMAVIGRAALHDRRTGKFDAWGFVIPGSVLALGLVFLAIARVASALIEARLTSLRRRAYDGDAIREALKEEIRLRDVRGWRNDEMRWRAQRAASKPWWRTELSGAQLLMNLYVIAAAVAMLVRPNSPDPRWVVPIVLAGYALFAKFIIPGIFVTAMFFTRPARRSVWRYYQWWARSKAAVILVLGAGALAAIAAWSAPPT